MKNVKEVITKFFANDIVKRAIKTFVQGFLAIIVISVADADLTDLTVIKSLIVGGVAGGISAVMNYIKSICK